MKPTKPHSSSSSAGSSISLRVWSVQYSPSRAFEWPVHGRSGHIISSYLSSPIRLHRCLTLRGWGHLLQSSTDNQQMQGIQIEGVGLLLLDCTRHRLPWH